MGRGMEERIARLQALKEKREKEHEANIASTKAEYVQKKNHPTDMARHSERKERALQMARKLEAKEKGLDYERVESLSYTAEELEAWQKKQAKKARGADQGFTDYAQMTTRKYKKLFDSIKPDEIMDSTASTGERDGLVIGSKPSDLAVDRLVKDLDKQIEGRRTFSKRKKFDDEADVTFINERNLKFNLKIARFYDRYTKELKDNLERGTAL